MNYTANAKILIANAVNKYAWVWGIYYLAISVRHCEDVNFEMFKSSDPPDPGVLWSKELDLYTIGIRLVKKKVKPCRDREITPPSQKVLIGKRAAEHGVTGTIRLGSLSRR